MKKENFGFGKLSKDNELAIGLLRAKITKEMVEWESLIGFKDADEMIEVLSRSAVDICCEYVGKELINENPERFDNFVKLVLSDIIKKL